MAATNRAPGPPPAWLWALGGSLAVHLVLVGAVSVKASALTAPMPAPPSLARVVPVRVSVLHRGRADELTAMPTAAVRGRAETEGANPQHAALPPRGRSDDGATARALAAPDEAPPSVDMPRLNATPPGAEAPRGATASGTTAAPSETHATPAAAGGTMAARSESSATPAGAGGTAAALSESSATPAGAGGTAAAGSETPGPAFGPNAGGRFGGGGNDVAQRLHQQLNEAAARCYPSAARRYRQEGTATVRFCLDGGGALRTFTLERSSGAPLLDGAARDCVVPSALPFLSAAGECFSVPVRFGSER